MDKAPISVLVPVYLEKKHVSTAYIDQDGVVSIEIASSPDTLAMARAFFEGDASAFVIFIAREKK